MSMKSSSRKRDEKSSKKQHKSQKQSPRSEAHSPRASTEVDASMDSPDKFMPSLKYDAPFSPAPAEDAKSSKKVPMTADESVDGATSSSRRNVLDANAHLVKATGDHRSPRQRALENKQAREAALAAGVELPARKHVPIEEDIAELQSPQVPRLPRKNILDANESLLQAPVDNRYRSPRQRALDRENSKRSEESPRAMDPEKDNYSQDHQQVKEEEEETNSLYLPYVRNVDDSQIKDGESPRPLEDSTSHEQQYAEEEEEENPLYLPYVRSVDDSELQQVEPAMVESASVDDTRFNEWPADENYVDVDATAETTEGVEEESAYPTYEAPEYDQDPEHAEVAAVDQTEAYEASEYPEEPVGNYQDESYQEEEEQALYPASNEVEPAYEQEYDQDYYAEEPEVANEDPHVAPEYAGTEEEQDASYAVESGLQYAAEETEADAEVEAQVEMEEAEPTEYVEGEDHTYTFESMLPEYYEDEEEEAEEVAAVQLQPSQAQKEEEDQSPEVSDATPAAIIAEEIAEPVLSSRAATPRQDIAAPVEAVERTMTASRSRLSSRGRDIKNDEDDLPADFLPEVLAPSQRVSSRPASGRPRTASKNLLEPEISEEPAATVRPRSSRVRDHSPELVVVRESALSIPSRPPSGRPRTGRQLSTAQVPDTLDSSLAAAAVPDSERPPTSSRPPTAGRPRTASADVRDSLEQAVADSASEPVAASRPTTGRPRSGAPASARVSEPVDALEQALEADASATSSLQRSVSRPGTGKLLSGSRPQTGTKSAVDALDQALADSVPGSARSSRPSSSSAR